jgi:hypothetical protein
MQQTAINLPIQWAIKTEIWQVASHTHRLHTSAGMSAPGPASTLKHFIANHEIISVITLLNFSPANELPTSSGPLGARALQDLDSQVSPPERSGC